ncbi:hypothetical protein E2493_02050 [Sphingomonas parva]|uniref:ABC transporter substrate-binding protein n=1 Tax=Sphingomonas parva TaxID=2555898 RepID=A0A4Y8ZXB1_9SPHN|nr:hypothetical protein [Sphingomonas parva]TFI60052.1 hypothetical protein E2493_02050 [Sphingomonas parva]
MNWRLALLCAGLLAGCSSFPKDVDGTLAKIERDGVIRVGMIAGGGTRQAVAPFLRAVEAETGAHVTIVDGPAEPLLLDLKEGRIDLILGETAAESPWQDEVAFIEPLRRGSEERPLELTPIARNGENAWIMLLQRAGRKVRGVA